MKKNRYRLMMHTPKNFLFSTLALTRKYKNNNIQTQYYSRSMTLYSDVRVR